MALSIEYAGVVFATAYHRDVSTEVDVRRHLGINDVLSAFHEVAERLPIFLRGDFVVVFFVEGYCHGPVGVDGG